MLNYFKNRTVDKTALKEMARMFLFVIGIVTYVLLPIILISTFNSPVLGMLILIGVPFAVVFVIFFECCFPKDLNKIIQQKYAEEEKKNA